MTDRPQGENIFAYISNSYYHFTAAEKKVADYVLSHKTGVQYMSISELAEECGVAEATVSRFCRRLKLKGYNAFKLALAKAEENSLMLCAGQGAYEGDALDDTQALADLLKDQGMPAHLEIWGGDVSHDWYWWGKMWSLFAPRILEVK